MKSLLSPIELILPSFPLVSLITKSPIAGAITLTTTATVASTNTIDIIHAFYILAAFFVADSVTGITAAYFEWRKTPRKDKWFFGKGEGFSSDKFKKMFVKIIVYLGTPLILQQFQKVFLIRNFKYEQVTDGEITLATGFILLFCLNEGYSIFHENLPKCGFSLYDQIRKILGLRKKILNGLQ